MTTRTLAAGATTVFAADLHTYIANNLGTPLATMFGDGDV